jgi:hypothetical protein
VREHLRAGTAAIVDRGIYLGKWLVTTQHGRTYA